MFCSSLFLFCFFFSMAMLTVTCCGWSPLCMLEPPYLEPTTEGAQALCVFRASFQASIAACPCVCIHPLDRVSADPL